MSRPPRTDRAVLSGIQAVVLALMVAGPHPRPAVVLGAAALVTVLVAATARERYRQGGGPPAHGVGVLAAFVGIVVLTTLPLPPLLLRTLDHGTAGLFAATAPEWPAWYPLALDPWAPWPSLATLVSAVGLFAVLVAYPWRTRVGLRLVLTLLAGGVLVAGGGLLLRIRNHAGPFDDPAWLAGVLAMTIPPAVITTLLTGRGLLHRFSRTAGLARHAGVPPPRAIVSSIVALQHTLVTPIAAGFATVLLIAAYWATGLRAAAAALLVGVGVAVVGSRHGAGRGTDGATVRQRRERLATWGILGAAGLALAVATARDLLASRTAGGPNGFAIWLDGIATGWRLLRAHPLTGVGLGAWSTAATAGGTPPVGPSDLAAFAADTGLVGMACLLGFVAVVVPVVRARWGRGLPRPRATRHEPAAAAADVDRHALLAWGVAGGVVALLLQTLAGSGMRGPAPGALLALGIGLLALPPSASPVDRSPVIGRLAVVLALALVPSLANAVLPLFGAAPLAPADLVARAERLIATEGEAGRDEAVDLLRRAARRAPTHLAAHVAIAARTDRAVEREDALWRAVRLAPAATALRDQLAAALWERGARDVAVAEVEESLSQVPRLAAHDLLPGESGLVPDAGSIAEATARAARFAPEVRGAVERGLRRALADAQENTRGPIVDDLATVLESDARWTAATALLRDEATKHPDRGGRLARAAHDALAGGDPQEAEAMLLTAVRDTPARGDLYRALAVDVYAARGDFDAANRVLRTGERQATDLRPVYLGVAETLARRDEHREEPGR
ncbi:MAG: hypothetical protein U0807_06970 [Candidatus Binatia bacterium]